MVTILLLAVLAGLTVVVVIRLSEHLGGEIGALLTTAPLVSTFGLIWVLSETGERSTEVLFAGNYSVLGAFLATVGYFFAIKWFRGGNLLRLAVGQGIFLVIYILTVWGGMRFLPLSPMLFTLNFLLAGLLAATFGQADIKVPPIKPVKGLARTAFSRFLAGFVVVAATGVATQIHPVVGGILSVFPGVFVTSLAVLGLTQSAPFSARVAQEGIPGILSILLFILGYWVSLPLISKHPQAGLALGTILAWLQYFLGLTFFSGMACPYRGRRQPLLAGTPLFGCALFQNTASLTSRSVVSPKQTESTPP